MAINLCDRCDESRKFMSDNCWPQPCDKKKVVGSQLTISRGFVIKQKKDVDFSTSFACRVFVGVDGFEPPTLCL